MKLAALQEENKSLHKLLKQREEEYLLITADLQQAKTKVCISHNQQMKLILLQLITSVDPVLTENRIKELMQNIIELQEENKMLLSIQKAKTQAIEDLSQVIRPPPPPPSKIAFP